MKHFFMVLHGLRFNYSFHITKRLNIEVNSLVFELLKINSRLVSVVLYYSAPVSNCLHGC